MNPLLIIEDHAPELRAYGARKIGVFGSYAKGEQSSDSDVDIYLEFTVGMKTYDNFFAIHELLENLFGKPIDLVTDESLSARKKQMILPTVHYAALNS